MKICIQLAQKGQGKVSPNPMVGCVVTDENGSIISTGYHTKYGAFHAEREALLKLKKGQGHTLFVNLEPCSHWGKTPPCTDIIIEKGIKHVVIGMRDENLKVSGIDILKNAGIEVTENILNSECKRLNEIFIKNVTENKPFIVIKTATTLDGKIAASNGSSKWITSQKSRNFARKLRRQYDAILTTSSTIIADNPNMEHSCKIILDRNLKTDSSFKIYQTGKIFVFHDKKLNKENTENITYVKSPVKNAEIDLNFVFEYAFKQGINSIFIEAGGKFNGNALNFADKVYQFIAPKITGDNSSLSCFNYRQITDISECKKFTITNIKKLNPDILIEYSPEI